MQTKPQLVLSLNGYVPAVPTPFTEDGAVDIAAFERFCDWQISEGARALVVCGTTGEAPTLSDTEHRDVVRAAYKVARGRAAVIAGTGSNSTVHAIELAKHAELDGADATLSVVPYYNRPTARGLYDHFAAILDQTALPVILYDIPGRTGCALSEETIIRLAQHPRCIGLKDAAGDPVRTLRLRAKLGPRFQLLCGDDGLMLGFLAHGANGCISVTSNVAPQLCNAMYAAWRDGTLDECQRLMAQILDLSAVLFRESNPAPLKHALSLRGFMSGRVRPPLCEVSESTKYEIFGTLAELLGLDRVVVEDTTNLQRKTA
jgi:4-hydroxy-tetrahydrodipicolinate synthase